MLPASWTFDFVNGEETCLSADGIDKVYPEPYFCYYNVPTLESMQAAHELVQEVIDEDGPFDGIIGFSQFVMLIQRTRFRRH